MELVVAGCRLRQALVTWTALGAATLGTQGCSSGLSDAQRAELLGKIDAALHDGEARDAKRRAALKELLFADSLSTEPCDQVVLVNEDGSLRARNDEEPSVGTPNFLLAKGREELVGMTGRRLGALRRDLEQLRSQASDNPGAGADPITPDTFAWALERVAARGAGWFPFEIQLAVYDVQRDIVDKRTGQRSPSHAKVRAIVWDYQRGAVVCQAEAEQSLHAGDTVEVIYDARYGVKDSDRARAWNHGLLAKVQDEALRAMNLGGPPRAPKDLGVYDSPPPLNSNE